MSDTTLEKKIKYYVRGFIRWEHMDNIPFDLLPYVCKELWEQNETYTLRVDYLPSKNCFELSRPHYLDDTLA